MINGGNVYASAIADCDGEGNKGDGPDHLANFFCHWRSLTQGSNLCHMQLEIFTLCDAATEHAGKLNIIGTFDALRALEAPVSHPQCAIAGRLRFEEIEEGEHRVNLTFADEDGNVVMPKFDSTLTVKFHPGQRTVTSHFVMVIQQVRLPKFGEYTIDLAIDGRQLGSLPLYVTQLDGVA
jgi:hypothetical protein